MFLRRHMTRRLGLPGVGHGQRKTLRFTITGPSLAQAGDIDCFWCDFRTFTSLYLSVAYVHLATVFLSQFCG